MRAAGQVDRAHELGAGLVADVEDMQPLEPGRHELTATGRRSRSVRVPGADDEVLEDDDVTLVAVAERAPDLLGVIGVADIPDVEPVPVPLDRELPQNAMSVWTSVFPIAGLVRLAGFLMWPRGTRSGVCGSVDALRRRPAVTRGFPSRPRSGTSARNSGLITPPCLAYTHVPRTSARARSPSRSRHASHPLRWYSPTPARAV